MTECTAIPCSEEATHVLTTKVHFDDMDPIDNEIEYCLKDALYFAAWLPYCYPDKYELVSIQPPASELFDRG